MTQPGFVNALEGHEATEPVKQALVRCGAACPLHQEIQGIVDLIYMANQPDPAYEAAGRRLPANAKEEIRSLARRLDATGILMWLKEQKTDVTQK